MNEWQPIETLPDDSNEYWVAWRNSHTGTVNATWSKGVDWHKRYLKNHKESLGWFPRRMGIVRPIPPTSKVPYVGTPLDRNVGREWKFVKFHGQPTDKECPVLAKFQGEYYIADHSTQVGPNSEWVSIKDIEPKYAKDIPTIEIDGYEYKRTFEGNIYRKKIVDDPNDSRGYVIWMTVDQVEEFEGIAEVLAKL